MDEVLNALRQLFFAPAGALFHFEEWEMNGCPYDHDDLKERICKSAAGYYIGLWCDYCGPVDRTSSYFPSREEAEEYLLWMEEMDQRERDRRAEVNDIRHGGCW